MLILHDVEANGLNPDKIHCICSKPYGKLDRPYVFTDMDKFFDFIVDTERHNPKHVFHNGLAYDVPVINRLISPGLIKPEDVIDTMVVSKLVNYKKYNTHSLAEIGKDLGVYKGDYDGGWDECTKEMIEYCKQDVLVLERIVTEFLPYIQSSRWGDAMRTEHDMAVLCNEMSETGFKFNKRRAEYLLNYVTDEMDELNDSFRTSFPPKLVPVTKNKVRYTKDGSLYKNITDNIAKYPKYELCGDEYTFYDYKEFNPGSSKDRVDVLWEAGWQPFDKTDGHKKWLRKERKGSW